MPTAIILAGPNGAGKTTFASQFLSDGARDYTFLNPDEVARELDPSLSLAERDMRAGRLLLARLDALVAQKADFVLETTLSGALYARRIPGWKDAGYQVALIYLRLASADSSVERVARRVEKGGHGVAEADLRRRFGRSHSNLEMVYKPLVDEWQVWRGLNGRFELLERSEP